MQDFLLVVPFSIFHVILLLKLPHLESVILQHIFDMLEAYPDIIHSFELGYSMGHIIFPYYGQFLSKFPKNKQTRKWAASLFSHYQYHTKTFMKSFGLAFSFYSQVNFFHRQTIIFPKFHLRGYNFFHFLRPKLNLYNKNASSGLSATDGEKRIICLFNALIHIIWIS